MNIASLLDFSRGKKFGITYELMKADSVALILFNRDLKGREVQSLFAKIYLSMLVYILLNCIISLPIYFIVTLKLYL